MKLVDRPTTCTGIHRSGWPYIMHTIKQYANGGGILFDDFVEHSFVYQSNKPHREPWVGVFHHPATIGSPLLGDTSRNMLRHTMQKAKPSLRYLKGVIVLAESSVKVVRQFTKAPILVVKHPTGVPTQYWKFAPLAWQVGFFLRDTRFIFSAPIEDGWNVARSTPWMPWMQNRDNKLKQKDKRKQVNTVREIPRVEDLQYDELMANSVVYNHIFGAAANNVVVECVARHTPIVVNRLPETEFYLGKEYPLFFNGAKVTEEQCESASSYLRDLANNSSWLNVETFKDNVLEFIQGVEKKCQLR